MIIPANLTLQAANLVLSLKAATFGPSISDVIRGNLSPIMLYDANTTPANLGCLSHRTYDFGFTRKASTPSPPEDWIALIQRGRCSFVEKIRHAQDLGAKAVIIGNDAENTEKHGQYFTMGGNASGDLVIPAFGITGNEYQEMIVRLESGDIALDSEGYQGLQVLLTPNPEQAKAAPERIPAPAPWKVDHNPEYHNRKHNDLPPFFEAAWFFGKIMACVVLVIGAVAGAILGSVWVVLKLFPTLDPDHVPAKKVDEPAQALLLEKPEKGAGVEQGWEKVVREE